MDGRDIPGGEGSATVDRLLPKLHSHDKQVRGRAAAGLAALGPPAVASLIATLQDPRWEVRYRAAEALGQIRDPRVCGALAPALLDPQDHVRYMAAKGLGQRQCRKVCAGLCRALCDENEFVRRGAAWALGRIGDPGVIQVLRERIEREPSPEVRKAIEESCQELEKESRI